MEIKIRERGYEAEAVSILDEQGNEYVIKERRGGGIAVESEGEMCVCPESCRKIDIYEL